MLLLLLCTIAFRIPNSRAERCRWAVLLVPFMEFVSVLDLRAGSGPTVFLGSRVQPKGVILVSPLRSALRVVLPGWVVVGCCCFLCDVFPNGRRVGSIGAPVLVCEGWLVSQHTFVFKVLWGTSACGMVCVARTLQGPCVCAVPALLFFS